MGERDPLLRDAVRFLTLNKKTALARIRGVDRLDVLEKMIEVEVNREGGPREDVLGAINQRKLLLEEYGERPDRLDEAGERSPAPAKSVVFVDEDGELVEPEEWRGSSATAKINRKRS